MPSSSGIAQSPEETGCEIQILTPMPLDGTILWCLLHFRVPYTIKLRPHHCLVSFPYATLLGTLHYRLPLRVCPHKPVIPITPSQNLHSREPNFQQEWSLPSWYLGSYSGSITYYLCELGKIYNYSKSQFLHLKGKDKSRIYFIALLTI